LQHIYSKEKETQSSSWSTIYTSFNRQVKQNFVSHCTRQNSREYNHAGRAWPDQPIRATQPAGRTRRPPTECTRQTSDRRQTDRRQTASSFNDPWAGA